MRSRKTTRALGSSQNVNGSKRDAKPTPRYECTKHYKFQIKWQPLILSKFKKSCESKTTWNKMKHLGKNRFPTHGKYFVKTGLSRRYTNNYGRATRIAALYHLRSRYQNQYVPSQNTRMNKA